MIPDPTTAGDFCRRFSERDIVELMAPGNVPSHTGAAPWIDAALALVQPHAKRLCVRGDTDFSLTRHFDRWAKSVDFIFGMDANAAMRSRALALDEAQWQTLQRKPRYYTVTDQKRKRNQPHEKQRIVRMEFRRFIHSIILIPCHVMRRAHTTTLRLIGYQPTLDRLFSTWRIIERTGFG